MKTRNLVLFGPLLLLGLTACKESNAEKVSLPTEPAPVTKTAPAASPKGAAQLGARRLNGTFEARRTAEIAAKVSGPVRKVYVEVGDKVADGDRLVDIDASNYSLQTKQAEASIKGSKAQISTLQTEYDRAQRLLAKQAIAPSQVDQLKGQLDAASAQLEAAEVSLSMARKARSDASIRAPFPGIITEVKVAEGEFAGPGATMMTLVEQDIVLNIRAPEDLSGKFKVGDSLVADLPSQGRAVDLKIERINPIVSSASRSFDIIAVPATADPTLQPGMFAEVTLDADAKPETAQ